MTKKKKAKAAPEPVAAERENDPVADAQEPAASAISIAGGPIKILIVDDEKEITDTLRRFFTFDGYTVDIANDPYTALRMVHRDNFLIVISDIAMPGMSGVELLSRIKAYNGMIQVIMITGFVTLENILSCLRLGADDCFLKPLRDMDQLKAAVDDSITKLRKWNQLMLDISRGRAAGDGDYYG